MLVREKVEKMVLVEDIRKMDDCDCQICIEDSVTESVQIYTVKSKFTVTTLTCLDHLAIREDCECETKACVVKPRHFVFLIDSSDSFDKRIDGDSSWFDEAKKFVKDFLQEGNFDRRSAPTVISIYNFSGIKNEAGNYVPGSNGDAGHGLLHYRCEIDAAVWNGTSHKRKSEILEKIDNAESLDMSGMLMLALQDISLDSFLDKSEKAMGAAPAGTKKEDWKPERILVVISDTEWDMHGIKDSNGEPANDQNIISAVRKGYSKIFCAMGSDSIEPRHAQSNFGLNRLTTSGKSTLFSSATMEKTLGAFRSKIFGELNLN